MTRHNIDLDVAPVVEPAPPANPPAGAEAPKVSDAVKWFLDYYWVRHALSCETLAAYRSDLSALELWISVFRYKNLADASAQDLRDYIAVRHRSGSGDPRTLPSMACIRRFFFFLVENGIRKDDPTEHLYVRTPRPARKELVLIPGKKKAH